MFSFGVHNNYTLASVRRWYTVVQSWSEITENRTMNCKLQLLRKFHTKSNLLSWLTVKTQNSGSTWGYHFLKCDLFHGIEYSDYPFWKLDVSILRWGRRHLLCAFHVSITMTI
jgi:hypothetical protein